MQGVSDALSDLLTAGAGISASIEYAQGGETTILQAVAENSIVETQNADGEFVRVEMRQYVLRADGLPALPAKGDTIVEVLGGALARFDVLPAPGGKACYEYIDADQAILRVFAKRHGQEGS